MKRSRGLFLLSIFSALLVSAASVSTQSPQPPPTAVPGFYRDLDSAQASLRHGEAIFYQRCSLCHLPRIRKHGTSPGPAPNLSGLVKGANKEREDQVRDFILKGNDRMPGWQYGLKPEQIDDLIAYLKTL